MYQFQLYPFIGVFSPPPKNTFRSDILRMFENEMFSDVFIHSPLDQPIIEDSEQRKSKQYIGCHRCLLAARCPFLDSLLPKRISTLPLPSWRRRFERGGGEGEREQSEIVFLDFSLLLAPFSPLPSPLTLFSSSSSLSSFVCPLELTERKCVHIVTDIRRDVLIAFV